MNKVLQVMILTTMLAVGITSCRPDTNVDPQTSGKPVISAEGAGDTIHQMPDSICGTVVSGNLVNASGATGTGNMFGADVYGTWDLLATPGEMHIQVALGRGWFASAWSVYMGPESMIQTDANGNPKVETFPANATVFPVRNNLDMRWPISSDMRCPNTVVVLCRMTVVELDFLGNAFNDQVIWLDGTLAGNAGARSVLFCAESCNAQPAPSLPCYSNPSLTGSCPAIPALDNPTISRSVTTGNVNINNSQEVIEVNGNVNLNTVNFNGAGTLIIGNGAVVSGGINANNGGRLIVRGTFNWNGAANLNNTFSIQIADGGVLNRSGDFTMNSQNNLLINKGTLNISNNLTYKGQAFNDGLIIARGINMNSNRADLVNGEGAVIQVAQFFNVDNHSKVQNCGEITVGNNLEINSQSTFINKSKVIVQQVTHNNATFENYCYFVSGVSGTADGFSAQGPRTFLGDGSVLVTRNFYWSPNGPLEIDGNATVTVAQSNFDGSGNIVSLSGPSSLRVNGGARLTGNGHLTVSDMNPLSQGDNPQNGVYPASVLSLINVHPQTTLDLIVGETTNVPFAN